MLRHFRQNTAQRTKFDWVMVGDGDMMLAVLFSCHLDVAAVLPTSYPYAFNAFINSLPDTSRGILMAGARKLRL